MSEAADILRAHYAQRCQGQLFLEAAQGGGINSQNYLVRVGSKDNEPAFVLKSEFLDKSPSDWRARLAFHQQVADREPLAPQGVLTDDGQPGKDVEGTLWRALEFRAGKPYSGSHEEALSAAKGLAQLHKNIRSLPGKKTVPALYDPLTPEESVDVLKQLNGPLESTDFGLLVKSLLTETLPPVLESIRQIDANKDLPISWVHRDFHPGNALFAQGRLTAILDLDSLATDFRMQAVAFAASRFAGNDVQRIREFLAAYHAVDPLTAPELKLVPNFIRREAVRRLNWIIRVNVLQGQDLWRGDLHKQADIVVQSHELDNAFARSEGELLKTINQPTIAASSGKP